MKLYTWGDNAPPKDHKLSNKKQTWKNLPSSCRLKEPICYEVLPPRNSRKFSSMNSHQYDWLNKTWTMMTPQNKRTPKCRLLSLLLAASQNMLKTACIPDTWGDVPSGCCGKSNRGQLGTCTIRCSFQPHPLGMLFRMVHKRLNGLSMGSFPPWLSLSPDRSILTQTWAPEGMLCLQLKPTKAAA